MSSNERLTAAQVSALGYVAVRAVGRPLDASLRVTINFHPDRGGLLDAMATDGRYRSQFETGTSNGGRTAHPGGYRWRWESRMFGGAYDRCPAVERPVYGALDHRRSPVGAAPRFGSAHLRLRRSVVHRSTFCHPDSAFAPTHFGTADRMALIERVEATPDVDPLDSYVEAHVHGGLRPATDAEALVLDPCFRDTDVEQAARRLGCPVEWHGGFRATTGELAQYVRYRGREYVELAVTWAEDGVLNPRLIGDAARAGHHDEQALKRVWHLLARFGGPG